MKRKRSDQRIKSGHGRCSAEYRRFPRAYDLPRIRAWHADGSAISAAANGARQAPTLPPQAPSRAAATDAKTARIHHAEGSITVKRREAAAPPTKEETPFSAAGITRDVFAVANRLTRSVIQRHPAHHVRAAGCSSPISDDTPVTTADPPLFDWRAHLSVHLAAEAFPLLPEKELKELAGDIKRNGLQAGIVVWSPEVDAKRQLLDGRNRLDALALTGQLEVDEQGSLCIKKQDGGLELIEQRHIVGGDPEKHAYSLNLHRRHLTPEQKRALIAKLLKAHPEKSDRQIAKTAKVSPTFVGKVRAEAEEAGDVSTVDTRADTKGRKQPARKAGSRDLAEKLRLAEIKIVELESEVEELKAENTKLREQLEAAQKVAS
jgi:hypothetical protein